MAHFLLNHPSTDSFMHLAELLKEVVCIVPNWFPNCVNTGAMLRDRKKFKTPLSDPTQALKSYWREGLGAEAGTEQHCCSFGFLSSLRSIAVMAAQLLPRFLMS